jgi:two-component system sensor histidine kinase/response regulator
MSAHVPHSIPPAPRAPHDGSPMTTLLLVDDSRVSRTVLKVFLVGRAVKVLEAENGVEALRMIREHHPDLVISDYEMPEMDGLALCEAVRSDPKLRGTKLLVLSGTATAEQGLRCCAAGALEVLAKPIQPPQLVAVLDRYLGPVQPAVAATPTPGAHHAVRVTC